MSKVNENRNDMDTFQTESYAHIDLDYHPIIKKDLISYGSYDDKETKHKQEYSNIYHHKQLLDKYVQSKKTFTASSLPNEFFSGSFDLSQINNSNTGLNSKLFL